MSASYINRGNTEPDEAKYHHGRSPSAWVSVAIAFIAAVIGTVAVVTLNWWLLAVAGGVVVVALIVGRIMQVAGLSNA
ncbi:HGxxPAAW family protein [Enemella sp. A6]|uniref:HGxxPAAW family protein n=1 Tax=Enemella sp. A6 TaxID=3440152 RepID=UPI003EBD8C3A